MTDLVERLRNPEPVPFGQPPSGLLDDAADEIERLRAENERLREEIKWWREPSEVTVRRIRDEWP